MPHSSMMWDRVLLLSTCVPRSTESYQLLYLITLVFFPPDAYMKKSSLLWLKPLKGALKNLSF